MYRDRGKPSRRQRLLDAGGRQRIDERPGIANEQRGAVDVARGRIHRRVPARRTGNERGARQQGSEPRGLADLRQIDLTRILAALQRRSARIHHHGDEAPADRVRHRPRPAVGVRLDQGVRRVRDQERLARLPEPDERHGPQVRLETTKVPGAGEDTAAPGAVEREPRRGRIGSLGPPLVQGDPGLERGRAQDRVEPVGGDLPAARGHRQTLPSGTGRSPPHGVAGRADEAGLVDSVADAERVEELRRGGREGLGEREAGAAGFVIRRTAWPQRARSRAAAAPAGPAPSTTTSSDGAGTRACDQERRPLVNQSSVRFRPSSKGTVGV